jgi:hypothetical protein
MVRHEFAILFRFDKQNCSALTTPDNGVCSTLFSESMHKALLSLRPSLLGLMVKGFFNCLCVECLIKRCDAGKEPPREEEASAAQRACFLSV